MHQRQGCSAELERPDRNGTRWEWRYREAAYHAGMTRSLVSRLHNPHRRECGCLPECWCQRTAFGRALRWYVPKSHHSAVSPEWKLEMEQRREAP